MKKTLAIASFLMIITSLCFAQEEKTYKPEIGNWNLEVNFAPFAQSPININYIRLRTFISESTAIQAGCFCIWENLNHQ